MAAAKLSSDVPFRDYIDYWLSTYVCRLPAAGTRESYARAMRLYWCPAFGSKPLDALRPSDIEAVLDALRDRGLKPSTIRTAFLVLSGALTRAKAERIIDVNPIERVRPPRPGPNTARWMTKDEAVRFVAAALVPDGEGSHYWSGPLIATAVMTGLRFGELRGLRWENVDLWGEGAKSDTESAGNIHVCEQIYSGHKSAIFAPPKSASAVRDVPVTPDLARLLLVHRERVRKHSQRVGTRKWQDYNLVFPNKVGGPATPEVVTHTRAQVAALVGIEPVPTMNALRHTYASILVDAGLQPHVVAKLLGHSDIQLLIDTYMHIGPNARQSAVDAMGGAMRRAAPVSLGGG